MGVACLRGEADLSNSNASLIFGFHTLYKQPMLKILFACFDFF